MGSFYKLWVGMWAPIHQRVSSCKCDTRLRSMHGYYEDWMSETPALFYLASGHQSKLTLN